MRRLLWTLAAVGLVAILVIGLTQASKGTENASARKRFDLDRALTQLEGAPPPLAGLHAQANELLGGGVKAVRARLKELRGTPVVLNKWASWCGPCRHEFPFFQEASTKLGRKIAFVGINSSDSTKGAEEFLAEFPVPYPSYVDPGERIARDVGAPANYPITVFIDEQGEQAFIRQGGYKSSAQLEQDIERYLGG